jgi:hypothetical protein
MKQLERAKIDEFKADFRGDVLLPGDAHYDEVRQIWNAMIDRRPAVIARCASPEDVVKAVRFAPSERPARCDPRRRSQHRGQCRSATTV